MKIKIFTIVFLIFNLSSFAQTSSQLTPSGEAGKYFNLVNQRFLLNGDESLEQISTFFRHNDTNIPSELNSGFWLIDSYTFQRWNYANWQNDSGEVYTYNQNNLLSEKKIRSWISSQWIDIYRYLYLYDSSLRISTLTEQYNSGGSWIDSLKMIYQYDSQGLLHTATTYRWNDSDWENWELMTSTYSNNQLIEDIYQVWNGSSWENSSRTVYEYNTGSISTTFSFWIFGTWVNLIRMVMNYDTNGLMTELRLQTWDFVSGWINLSRLLFTYDNYFKITEGLWQDWDSNTSSWVNYSRITTTYNADDLPENDLTELWEGNSYWVNDFLSTYGYDGSFNHIETVGQQWTNGNWANSERELYTYFKISSVETSERNPDEFILIGNYPNPFNPVTTIKFYIPKTSLVVLKVYNSIGEEVAVLVDDELASGTYDIKWNAASAAGGLPSGVYFYQLRAGDYTSTKKMMLLK